VLLSQFGEGHTFALQLAFDVTKRMHVGALCARSGPKLKVESGRLRARRSPAVPPVELAIASADAGLIYYAYV
jgi:hypothetical protein